MDKDELKCILENEMVYSHLYTFLKYRLFTKADLLQYLVNNLYYEDYYYFEGGYGTYTFNKFDSRVLGIPVGVLKLITPTTGNKSADILLKQNIISHFSIKYPDHYLILRVNSQETSSILALENEGFNLIDGQINAHRGVSGYEFVPSQKLSELQFEVARAEDFEKVVSIAKRSFIYDRFHNDPLIEKEKANDVYSIWSKNSLNKIAADEVLVCKDKGEVVAFLDLKIDRIDELNISIGDYGLGATSEGYQKRGIFEELNRMSLEWFFKAGVNFVQMTTQLTNIPSAKTYLGPLGFQLSNTFLTFRKYSLMKNSSNKNKLI